MKQRNECEGHEIPTQGYPAAYIVSPRVMSSRVEFDLWCENKKYKLTRTAVNGVASTDAYSNLRVKCLSRKQKPILITTDYYKVKARCNDLLFKSLKHFPWNIFHDIIAFNPIFIKNNILEILNSCYVYGLKYSLF